MEITFDECQEVSRRLLTVGNRISKRSTLQIIERVPVELCKRKRVDEDSITLSRGKVERKEGEKRRTPAFRRSVNKRKELLLSTVVSN